MESGNLKQIATDFAESKDVEFIGENDNIALFQCIVDEDNMGMFIIIKKDTMKPYWSNGMEKEWLRDFADIMSNIEPKPSANQEESEAMKLFGIK